MNATDPTPGKGRSSSASSQPQDAGHVRRTRADELGIDIRNVPDRYTQPVALTASSGSGSSVPSGEASAYSATAEIDRLLAEAEAVRQRSFGSRPRTEKEKGQR
ncbi:hypothetical protein [Noviherbaspirillum pedocola]|uniref:Uncharacterized protein n=1 Tax=Noviherbaspirillum pedocola TaxID=2801341 RepID=A0A934SSE7_9BURK|nr:hypothetical protein [Noviherbaspirillum pedocola]MBK4735735.1 hypothetical protein [Noviherbaspirillum pedocola]